MSQHNEVYLGDGLYAKFDGFTFWLRAPRAGGGEHFVALEPDVLKAFLEFIHAAKSPGRPADQHAEPS